jgi:hypothetical protein
MDRRLPARLEAFQATQLLGHTDVEVIEEPDASYQRYFNQWFRNDRDYAGALLLFALDGTGGLFALWSGQPGVEPAEAPVVFLGSEGEVGVVASTFDEFLRLCGSGCHMYTLAARGRVEPYDAGVTVAARDLRPRAGRGPGRPEPRRPRAVRRRVRGLGRGHARALRASYVGARR